MQAENTDNTAGNNIAKGIALMVACTLCFASMDALSKLLIADYPAAEILFIRYIVFLVVIVAMVRPHRVIDTLRVRRPIYQTVRAATLVIEQVIFIVGLMYLGLGEMHVIMAATPLIVAGLSVPMLGEHVGIRRWSALGVGCVGVLIVLRPEGELFQLAVLLPVTCAIMFGLYQIMTRVVSRDNSSNSTVLYTAVVGTISFGVVAPFVWVMPSAQDWGLFAALAVLGTLAHILLIKALAYAPAAILQPFFFLTLAWAVGLGYLLFGAIPSPVTLMGAGVILSAGLYTLHRERINARKQGENKSA